MRDNLGQRLPDYAFGDKRQNLDYYWLTTGPFLVDPTLPQTNETINIGDDGDFYCCNFAYQAAITTAVVAPAPNLGALLTEATNVIPLARVQIIDTGSNRGLMNDPVPLTCLAGDGKHPYRLPRPRVFTRNSTIQFKFSPYQVAGTLYLIEFVLGGYINYGKGVPANL